MVTSPVDRLYAATDVEFELSGGGRLLCTPEVCPDEAVASGDGWVITAHNPFPVMLSAAENERRHQMLRAEIKRLGYPDLRAVGRARAGSYEEESCAVWGLSQDEAVAIGARYGQRAIFKLTINGLRIVSCAADPANKPKR